MAVLTSANIALLNARGTALARVPDIVLGSRLALLDSDGTYTGTLGEAVVAIGGVGGVAANDIVYVSGSSGTSRVVLPADADAIATMRNLYYAKAAIAAGASGYVYKRGLMTAQNTNAATVGDPVYADTTTAGGWTLTKPSGAADIIVEIGIVTVKSASVGVIDVDIGAGVLEFDVHSLTGLGAAPAIDDRLVISDESAAGDPHLYVTVQELFNGIAGAASFTGAIVKDTDQLFLDDAGVVKRMTFQVLMDGVEDLAAFTAPFVKDTDTVLVSNAGVATKATYQELMDGVDDLTALAAAPALTDSVLIDDAGVAKKLTVQYLLDAAFSLAADTVQTGDFFMLLESGGVAKLESISDLGDFMAGTGLSASGGVLAVSPTESAAADVVPTTDAMLFLDSTDSNIQKQESIQHFLDSVDDLVAFTGTVAPAADKLLYLDAGVAKVGTVQVLFDGVDDLTALAAAPALTDKVLIGDAGTAKSLTIQYLLDGVAGLAADTVADGDSFLLSEAGGVSKLEAIADLATLFAGTGLTATSSVIAVSQASHWTFLIGGANGEDTDGVLTNDGGIAGGSIPTGVTQTEAAAAFCKVYDLGTTSYQNLATSSSGADVTDNYQIFSDTIGDGDAIFFGNPVPFCEMGVDMSVTVQTYTGDALTWKYYNGATWATLTLNYDGTDATAQDGKRSFGRDGAINFVPPADWAAVAVDTQTAYWIKAEITTVANVTAVRGLTDSKEHLLVAPDGDAFRAPHDGNISKVRVTNTGATIHDQAIKFVLFDFTTGTYSLELTWPASQNTDTFTTTVLKAGSAGVDVEAGDKIGILITDDAASTVNPTDIAVELTVTPA